MQDKRTNELKNWLAQYFTDDNFSIKEASNDASFRRYFRVEHNEKTFIVMDAPPKKEDTERFIRIDGYLLANNVRAPKIFATNVTKGFLLLEDFGKTTLLDAANNRFNINRYRYMIDTLIKIQSINTKNLNLPTYDKTLLKAEMTLFTDWYLTHHLDAKTQKILQKIFEILAISATHRCTQVFVHRDYHSRNLMMLGTRGIGVLDFQDAIIGSRHYDLCSLLRDAYFELSPSQLQVLLEYYYQQTEVNMPFIRFKKQFDFMSLQRHLKILGIFKRLSVRDGKHQYLDNLPLVKKYALAVCGDYQELHTLHDILCSV